MQPWRTPFFILNQSVVSYPVLTVASWPACRFLRRQVKCSYLFKNFPQFVVIHTVKGFSVVNEAEVDVFLGFLCFLYDPRDVAIWFLVPLPFLNPACTSGSSQFIYHWSPAWRILSITLLVCEMSATVPLSEALCLEKDRQKVWYLARRVWIIGPWGRGFFQTWDFKVVVRKEWQRQTMNPQWTDKAPITPRPRSQFQGQAPPPASLWPLLPLTEATGSSSYKGHAEIKPL